MTADHDKLLCSLLVFQRTLFALFVVDLLLHIGWDTRYTDETPLSVLLVRECILIWAPSLDSEKQLLRLLSSNMVVLFVHAILASAEMRSQAV